MVLTLEMITMSAGLRSRATLLILLAGGQGVGVGMGGALNGHFQRSPFEVRGGLLKSSVSSVTGVGD